MNVFIVSILNNLSTERKRNMRIRNGFEDFFVCALIISDDDIISA